MYSRFTILLLLQSWIFIACHQKSTNNISSFKKSLNEKYIASADFSISIPANYIIKESQGPDFSVYYFTPKDTADKKSFRGGFYLGNAPGGFDDFSCKIEQRNAYLLGDEQKWTVANCGSKYRIQIISKSKSSYNWANYIHAFGSCSSKLDVDKMLDIFSTLKQNK